MRSKVAMAAPQRALDRLLEALGQELIDASDEELEHAARDLRMDIRMKGSGAFAGLRYFAIPQLSEFFDTEAHPKPPPALRDEARATRQRSKRKTRKSKGIDVPKD